MQTSEIARAAAAAASADMRRVMRLNVATALYAQLAAGPTVNGADLAGLPAAVANGPIAKWCWESAGLLMQEAGLA